MRELLKSIYYHKWFPRFFYTKPDGGANSGVTGYFFLEWKPLFSVGILHFRKGTREAFHNHAFNAVSFWLKGSVTEVRHSSQLTQNKYFSAGFRPKFTPRSNCHKIIAHEDTYCLTLRGPWLDYWYEIRNGERVTLTHGRKIVS